MFIIICEKNKNRQNKMSTFDYLKLCCKNSYNIKSSCCFGTASVEPVPPPPPPTPQSIELDIERPGCCTIHFKRFKSNNKNL